MTHADINDLETRDYIFKIGDRGKGIQARYDENTDALIFPRIAFDYVCKLLNDALSQEPCTDAVSRAELIGILKEKIKTHRSTIEIADKLIPLIEQLPSVTPSRRKGHWKRVSIDKYSEHAHYWYECGLCGKQHLGDTNFCPNCGAKMESEDKE